MAAGDEGNLIERIPPWRFPRSEGNRHRFESLAAPVSHQLERHADEVGASAGAMHPIAARDPNADFSRTIPGAVGEIAGQLGSQSEIDPAPVYLAALESVDDVGGSGDGLPPEGTTSGGVTGGGGSEFGIVQWAESGAVAPGPAPAPAPGPAPGPEPPPDEVAPPPPAPPPAPPPDEVAPPPPEPPPPPPPEEWVPAPPEEPPPSELPILF